MRLCQNLIMINENCAKQYCCEDLSLIENYDLAINDPTQTWFCHHILGEQYSRQYLIDNNLYESRPANELRFVTHAEHDRLHKQGVPKSEATKQKMSDAKKGVPLSEAHKQAISDALTGVPRPDLKGVPLSEEHKKAIGDANSKKILQYTKSGQFIREWPSATEAQRELGIAKSGISKCCKGKYKSAGGYVWKYAV